MKPASNKLSTWSGISGFLGIIFLVVAFFMFVFDSASCVDFFISGAGFLILSPVLKGFSIIVLNAERQIEEYHD